MNSTKKYSALFIILVLCVIVFAILNKGEDNAQKKSEAKNTEVVQDEELIKQQKLAKEREEKVKKEAEMLALLKKYPQMKEEVWVDMGIESDGGKPLYWATSNFIVRKDGTVGLTDYGALGSLCGWGDITGIINKSSDINDFGGNNPPKSIIRNVKYDIVAARIGNGSRLPSMDEWIRLLENTNHRITALKKELAPYGSNGLPSWVQGQWMIQQQVSNGNENFVFARSFKIDGNFSSVIDAQGGQVKLVYEGVYTYDSNTHQILLGGLKLYVDQDQKVLKTEDGDLLKKVSNDTESQKVEGMLLTSKINGNSLFFPLPSRRTAISSGNSTISFENSQVIEFWTGNCNEQDKRAYFVDMLDNGDVHLGLKKRSSLMYIRPVSSNPISVAYGGNK